MEGSSAALRREGARERHGWVPTGSCHIQGRCGEGRVMCRMGEEDKRTSLVRGCWLGIDCRCLQGTGAHGSPACPKTDERGVLAARGNKEGCCVEGGTGDVRVCGALIIPFSVQVGSWGGRAPRGAGCLLAEDPGGTEPRRVQPFGICFLLASPILPPSPSSFAWDGDCSVQRPLPAS